LQLIDTTYSGSLFDYFISEKAKARAITQLKSLTWAVLNINSTKRTKFVWRWEETLVFTHSGRPVKWPRSKWTVRRPQAG